MILDHTISTEKNPKMQKRYYKWFVLITLSCVYAFNTMDRNILAILANDMKSDLGLTDSELGFLYGTAFSVFYALFGVPFGRVADMWSRTKLISGGLTFWSIMTTLSSQATSFITLGVLRFGVGVGEASSTPAAYSLLYDYFSESRRTTAFALYASGAVLGTGLSFALGGWFLDVWHSQWPDPQSAPFGLRGWQVAFIGVGLPGLVLAPIVYFIREPRAQSTRMTHEAVDENIRANVFFREVSAMFPGINLVALYMAGGRRRAAIVNLIILVLTAGSSALLAILSGDHLQWAALGVGLYSSASWMQLTRLREPGCINAILGSPSLIRLYIASAALTFASTGIGFWVVPWLQRRFLLDASSLGLWIGLVAAVASVVGMFSAGVLADFMRKRDKRGRMVVAIAGAFVSVLAIGATLFSSSFSIAMIILSVYYFSSSMVTAPIVSSINGLVEGRYRAVTTAFALLVVCLIGNSLGPYCVGKISDILSVRLGIANDQSLAIAMVGPILVQFFGMLILVSSLKSIVRAEQVIAEKSFV